jgi:hypothetical protein
MKNSLFYASLDGVGIFTLNDLLTAIDEQLTLMTNDEKIKQNPDGRWIALVRTDIETALLRAEKYKDVTGEAIPLYFDKDDNA